MTGDGRPATGDGRPATSNGRPATSKGRRATSDENCTNGPPFKVQFKVHLPSVMEDEYKHMKI